MFLGDPNPFHLQQNCYSANFMVEKLQGANHDCTRCSSAVARIKKQGIKEEN